MADKTTTSLTAGTTPLAGTELVYGVQGGNSRKFTASDVAQSPHTQAWGTITGTPTTLSGYGITDAQPLDTDLTAIAALTTTGYGRAFLALADEAAFKAYVNLEIGVDVQAQGATLTSLEGLSLVNGDLLYATAADTLARRAIGTNGQVLQVAGGVPTWATVSGTGDLISTNNLSDVASASTSRTNLGLAIGTNVQAFSTNLSTLAAVTPGATGLALLDDTTPAAARTTLGLVIGTDVQAFDASIVKGPASAVDGRIAIYDGTTGKLLKDAQALMTNINYNGFPLNGGVVRVAVDRLSESLSVKDIGALGDNSTDDTTAIVAAITAAAALDMVVFFPSGIYRYTALGNIPASVKLLGANAATTFLRKTTGTGNGLSLNGGSTGINGITFDATVAQTAGSYVNITSSASRVTVEKVDMVAPFRGIILPSSIALVDLIDVDINETVATTGVSIEINGGFAVSFTRVRCRNDPGARPFSHISVAHVADLTLTDCQLISGDIDLNIAPGNGQSIGLIKSIGTQYDDAGTTAIRIAPTGTGVVNEVTIDSQWIYGIGTDVLITNVGGGTVNSVQVVNSMLIGAAAGVDAVGVGNVMVQNCRIGGHTTAISFDDVSGGLIQGNIIGPHGLYGANTTGVLLDGTTNNVNVSGNKLTGNTTALTNTASGTANEIRGNLGYPAMGGSVITATASPMTVTAGSTPEKITVNAAATTPLLELDDGAGGAFTGILQNMGAAWAIQLEPNQRLRITYTGTPTILRFRCK